MTDSIKNKLFAELPRISRMKHTLLMVGIICLVLIILTIFCYCKPPKKVSSETIEVDQQENVQWVISNNKQSTPIPTAPEHDDGLTLHHDQEAKLAKALEEIDRNKSLLSERENQSKDKANSSPIAANFNSEESRKNITAINTGTVHAGTLVPVALMTDLTSDMPGEVLAQVTRPIYDANQSRILIPQGTKVLLTYDVATTANQNRIALKASTLVFPSGQTQVVDGLLSIDNMGNTGISDEVNHHYVHNFISMLIPDLVAAASLPSEVSGIDIGNLAQQFTSSHSPSVINATIHVRKGQTFFLLLAKDVNLQCF